MTYQPERRSPHRLEIELGEGSFWVKLICPEGGCDPGTQCAYCGADITDPESDRCYDCKGMQPDECVLRGWVDNVGAELVQGKITLPVVDVEWGSHPDEGPLLHVGEPS